MNAEQHIRARLDIQYLARLLGLPELPPHALKFSGLLRAGQKENQPTYILASKESLKSTVQRLMIIQDLLGDEQILFGSMSGDVVDANTGAIKDALKELMAFDPVRLQKEVTGFLWQSKRFCLPGWTAKMVYPSFSGVTTGKDIEGVRMGRGYLDDIADRKSMNSDAARKDSINWLVTTFLRRIRDGAWVGGIGSPWHEEDVMMAIIQMGWEVHCYPRNKTLEPEVYKAYKNVHWHGEEYSWLWPERDANKDIHDLEMGCGGPVTYALCYLVNPSAIKGRRFNPAWFQYWGQTEDRYQTVPQEGMIYMGVDLATGKGRTGDNTAIVVIRHTPDNTLVVLEASGQQLNPLETERSIIAAANRWNPRKIFIEDSGQQIMFIEQLKRNTGLPIIAQSTETRDKISRIDTLAVPIEGKRIIFHRSQYDLISELSNFPDASHDDLPDALEMACRDILRKGARRGLPRLGRDRSDWREGVGGGRKDMPAREL